MVNRTTDASIVSSVTVDDHSGIGQAVRHLVALGHRRIAHVGGAQTLSTGFLRYHAFLSWMHAEGLEVAPARSSSHRFQGRAAPARSTRVRPPRGLHRGGLRNDLIALGGYDVLRTRGLDCRRRVDRRLQRHPLQRQVLPAADSVRLPPT